MILRAVLVSLDGDDSTQHPLCERCQSAMQQTLWGEFIFLSGGCWINPWCMQQTSGELKLLACRCVLP